PPWPIEKYFVQHQAEARLISAHMMATILSIEQLRQTAISLVSSSGAIKSGTQWASSSTVGAVYDRTFFVESTKYARSQTAPTVRQLQLSEIESHFQLHRCAPPPSHFSVIVTN